jgi:hypothetical protein
MSTRKQVGLIWGDLPTANHDLTQNNEISQFYYFADITYYMCV